MKRVEKKDSFFDQSGALTTKKSKLERRDEDEDLLIDVVPFWGPYLAERHWGTVREDLSTDGTCWESFSHDDAVWRSYRSGEDGLLGICDRHCLMCTSVVLWNGHDSILKERLFGLTNTQGNHGEDVKELYYYLDNNKQHTYMKALYKYPQNPFPYQRLVDENAQRGVEHSEFEILNTGIFENNEYFDVFIEYALVSEKHLVCRVTVHNRASEKKRLVVMPHIWFRNTWNTDEIKFQKPKPSMKQMASKVVAEHEKGKFYIHFCEEPCKHTVIFTENETRVEGNQPCHGAFYKDAFHKYVIHGDKNAVNAHLIGTKCAAVYDVSIPAHGQTRFCWSICPEMMTGKHWDSHQIDHIFKKRILETNKFFSQLLPRCWSDEERNVARQALSGLLWSRQFYMYDVAATLSEIEIIRDKNKNDSSIRIENRNSDWCHLQNYDVISMPDKWEFPWYASWDLAFHMSPFTRFDCPFVKYQLKTLLLHRYMKPDGQLPGCEFDLGDPNPPLHAWSCLEAFIVDGGTDHDFLGFCFRKLLLNFKWWTSFTDHAEQQTHCGFLGMDNISVLNRSEAPPEDFRLMQADANGWMAYFALNMLKMFLILAEFDDSLNFDLAEKFLRIFLAKAKLLNKEVTSSEPGHWDSTTHFYYDVLLTPQGNQPIKVKSLVGIVPMFASLIVNCTRPGICKKFYDKLYDASKNNFVHRISSNKFLLTAVPVMNVMSIFTSLFSESEFLSPYGIRSLSKVYEHEPYKITINGKEHTIKYEPGEANDDMFGGNSNWRGPVWLCMNYLIVQSLENLRMALGDDVKIQYPAGCLDRCSFDFIIKDISRRIVSIFLPNEAHARPLHGSDDIYAKNAHWRPLVLFYEYFHAETGRGCGASHQTGWTSLVLEFLHKLHSTG